MDIHFFFNGIEGEFNPFFQIKCLDGNMLVTVCRHRHFYKVIDGNWKHGAPVVIGVIPDELNAARGPGHDAGRMSVQIGKPLAEDL